MTDSSGEIPQMDAEEPRGLHGKYRVTKADGTPVDGEVFVLRPDRDPHALNALRAYAASVFDDNDELAADLRIWIARLEAVTRPRIPKLVTSPDGNLEYKD